MRVNEGFISSSQTNDSINKQQSFGPAIHRLSKGEAREAAGVLAQAFIVCPNTRAMWQTIDHKTVPAMATAFRLGMLDRQANTTLVARLDGHISGVLTMTRWPHCQFSWGEMVITAPRLFFAYHTNLFRSFQAYNMLERHDPHQPHWHIAAVGVLPALQGIGIGTRLLEACCAIVDSTGLPAYLETDLFVNTRLYGRFDFDIKEKVEVFGVTNWLMWRAPRTSPKPVASVAKDPILVA